MGTTSNAKGAARASLAVSSGLVAERFLHSSEMSQMPNPPADMTDEINVATVLAHLSAHGSITDKSTNDTESRGVNVMEAGPGQWRPNPGVTLNVASPGRCRAKLSSAKPSSMQGKKRKVLTQTCDSECFDSESIMRMQSNAAAAVVLVARSLAMAAYTLLIPKQDKWADCWSRVQTLTIARIGSAHYSATTARLYACGGSTTKDSQEVIKREACRYLGALISSVHSAPPHKLWRDDTSEIRRRNWIEAFFLTDLLSRIPKATSDPWHPEEPLWNALSHYESECFDSESIMRMPSNAASVDALVARSLEIAAHSLRLPTQDKWDECWSRVQALTIARIGSAHCSVKNAKLFSCGGSTNEVSQEGIEREKWIKRKARLYLISLISSVAITPPHPLWLEKNANLRRQHLIQSFFLDGANHRQNGLIHPDFLSHL